MPEQDVKQAWTARSPVILGLLAVAVLVGGLGTWSVTTQIASAIVAPGLIETEQNQQVVQHPDGGKVASIEVHEGDVVAAGQVLIRLDAQRLDSELAITNSQIYEMAARRGRLEAERDGATEITFSPELLAEATTNPDVAEMLETNRRLFVRRRDNLAASVAQLEKRKSQIASQNDGLAAQLAAQEEQVALIAEELANQQQLLDKGLTQSSTVLALRRQKAQLEGAAGDIIARKAQNGERITEIDLQILQLQSQRQEEASTLLSDQEGKELQFAEHRRALLEQLDRLEIRAPLAGAIHSLQVFSAGAVIRPAETVLAIVPQDQPLVIGAQVPTLNIDQVHMGQKVLLRFPSFSTRTTPEIFGTVMSVSPDALYDQRSGASYYRARIEIDEGETAKLPEGSVLIPGMPVEAFLSTGERSPFAYLMKPFMDYFDKAFRER